MLFRSNSFPIFSEILDSGSGKKDRNDNSFSLTFSALPNPIWLEMKLEWCFLSFLILLLFFLEFSILGRIGRIGMTIFFCSLSRLFLTRFGLK